MAKNFRNKMKEQFNTIEKLNADSNYESKTKIIEKRKVVDLKELPQNYIIPPLRADDYQRLFDSIKQVGVKKPLDISKNNIVLDGNHRLKIARELGIEEVEVIVKDIPEKLFLAYAIEDALNRRQLNDAQRADMILVLKEQYVKEGIKRRVQNLKKGAEAPESVEINTVGKSIDRLSKKAGISKDALKKSDKIKKENPELFENVKAGSVSLNTAYNQVKKTKTPAVSIVQKKEQSVTINGTVEKISITADRAKGYIRIDSKNILLLGYLETELEQSIRGFTTVIRETDQ